MTINDGAVVTAGVAAATSHFWGPAVDWLPQIFQITITGATVIFVVARAILEVRKLWIHWRTPDQET